MCSVLMSETHLLFRGLLAKTQVSDRAADGFPEFVRKWLISGQKGSTDGADRWRGDVMVPA